jgi:hypothetical protein
LEHDPHHREEFQKEDEFTKRKVEAKFLRLLEDLRDQCDRAYVSPVLVLLIGLCCALAHVPCSHVLFVAVSIAKGQARFSGAAFELKLDPKQQETVREKEKQIQTISEEVSRVQDRRQGRGQCHNVAHRSLRGVSTD